VSSVESIAWRARQERIFGRITVVVDAQRHEYYSSTWDISGEACREVSPLKIIPAAEVAAGSTAGEKCVGPDLPAESGVGVFPDAAMLAVLAYGRTDFIEGQELEPIYLRETSFVKASVPRPM
jgi:hypothetical protein